MVILRDIRITVIKGGRGVSYDILLCVHCNNNTWKYARREGGCGEYVKHIYEESGDMLTMKSFGRSVIYVLLKAKVSGGC